ncbi:MAG: 5-oxoprolinase subunit PxpB [Candidatus Methylomirabilales bacterium]
MASRGEVRFLPAGDAGLVVEFGDAIDPALNARVRALAHLLAPGRVPGVREVVPTYRSLGVEYDPARLEFEALVAGIRGLLDRLDTAELPPSRRVELPTLYGGEFGPDLPSVCEHTGLSEAEVVRLHSGTEYPVYMIGFTAGFAYLGGLPERLHTPRLASPRTRVPKGSVGIGGAQTGAYSAETPGGWRLIGRTPVPLFDPLQDPPTPMLPGDRVRFVPIDAEEYRRLEQRYSAERNAECGLRNAESAAVPAGDVPLGMGASAPLPAFEVVTPGPLTTVQDRGRVGYQKFGVSVSGAVDGVALQVGNILVGNPRGAAGLEFMLMGPSLRFLRDVAVALTGGESRATLDGRPAPWYESFLVRAGQVLEVGGLVRGFRGYLTVAGGIEVPVLLNSRSTCLGARFGGHRGRRLEAGDRLSVAASGRPPLIGAAAPRWRPEEAATPTVRVVLGPQDGAFTEAGRETFLSSVYQVTSDVDRMGCRLDGPALTHARGADIISDWIPLGGIQVPGSGKPIILLANRQTTGGYTKIATVIGPDIPVVAQRRPGDALRFRAVAVAEAQAAARDVERRLAELPDRLETPSLFTGYMED